MCGSPKIFFVAHWDWVLYHFRLPIAEHLCDRGCEVAFVSPRGEYISEITQRGFEWLEWNLSRRSTGPLIELSSILDLVGIYHREQPDLVHHFTAKPNLYGTVAARVTGVPRIVNTFSGLGYFFHSQRPSRIARLALTSVMRGAFSSANVWTVFQNESDYATLKDKRIVGSERAVVIPGSGVDLHHFYPQPIEKTKSKSVPVVILVARILRDKGIAEFVDAAHRLRASGHKATFWVVGSPDPGNPASIADEQLQAWQRQGTVQFLGHRNDIPSLLRRSDIAVLPSYHEGLSRFLLEAAASGLPIVATDIPGCREVARHGLNALLVPPRDSSALTEAIGRLLADESTRTEFGLRSRQIAESDFSVEKTVTHYEELYGQLGVLNP